MVDDDPNIVMQWPQYIYGSTMNLHVVLYHLERFVAWAQWDLNEVGPSSWVGRHENGEADIKIDIFQNFFTFFLVTIEQVSEAVLKTCRAWALRELNLQLLSKGNSKLGSPPG